jgi:prepilin-type N-terminal cleavage/methylation domain-containing protein
MTFSTWLGQRWAWIRKKTSFRRTLHSRPPFDREDERGYTLVELMVITAIVAIMSAVAIPAYINYVHRIKQGEAISTLIHAKMEQEMFLEQNGRFASTIGILGSGTNTALTSLSLPSGYSIRVDNANTQRYQMSAVKAIAGTWDRVLLTVSAQTLDAQPIVVNEGAMHFSIFKWLFE